MINLTFENFTSEYHESINNEIKNIKRIVFGYDGGRLAISINGKSFYSNQFAGHDFIVEIDLE